MGQKPQFASLAVEAPAVARSAPGFPSNQVAGVRSRKMRRAGRLPCRPQAVCYGQNQKGPIRMQPRRRQFHGRRRPYLRKPGGGLLGGRRRGRGRGRDGLLPEGGLGRGGLEGGLFAGGRDWPCASASLPVTAVTGAAAASASIAPRNQRRDRTSDSAIRASLPLSVVVVDARWEVPSPPHALLPTRHVDVRR